MEQVGFFNKVELPSAPKDVKVPWKQQAKNFLGKSVEWYFDFGQTSYKFTNEVYGGRPLVVKNDQKRSIFKIVLKVIECAIKVLLSPILIIPMLLGKIYFRSKHVFLINSNATLASLNNRAPERIPKEKPAELETDPSLGFSKMVPPNYNVRTEIMAHPLMQQISEAAEDEEELGLKLEGTLKTILKDDGYANKFKVMERKQAREIFHILTRRYKNANGYLDEQRFPENITMAKGATYIIDPILEEKKTSKQIISEINRVLTESPHLTSIPIYLSIKDNETNERHATLVFVDMENGTLEYYDSNQDYGDHEQICEKLEEVAEGLDLEFIKKVNNPIQQDNYSCAFWTCYFLKKRLEDPEFNPDDIKNADVLERQIRLEFTLMRILYDLELKDEVLRTHATPAAYTTYDKDYFEMFETFLLPVLANREIDAALV